MRHCEQHKFQGKYLLLTKTELIFEVFMAVKMYVVMPCSLAGGYQCFRGTYCLLLQGRKWRRYIPPKFS
jgi:hypothetical protein